jgi:hypothetical protein
VLRGCGLPGPARRASERNEVEGISTVAITTEINHFEGSCEGTANLEESWPGGIYVSTDVEADGPIPAPHSMLSFGSAAYTANKTLVATFNANLQTLSGAAPDPRIMKWWETQPNAWRECRRDLQEPANVMPAYKGTGGRQANTNHVDGHRPAAAKLWTTFASRRRGSCAQRCSWPT